MARRNKDNLQALVGDLKFLMDSNKLQDRDRNRSSVANTMLLQDIAEAICNISDKLDSIDNGNTNTDDGGE